MALQGELPIKPLASWKTWWSGSDQAQRIAASIQHHIDPTKMPGDGKLVQLKFTGKVTQEDLNDHHTSKVVEGLLEAYPSSREPSGYLLGDSVMVLNKMLGGAILGLQKANPVDEKARRDKALKQGAYLKMLLSYARVSSGRSAKGRSPTVTYLKELALAKGRPERKGKGSSSPSSTASTTSEVTLLLDGRPITCLDDDISSPATSSVETAASSTNVAETDVVAKTLMLLGLDPNAPCSQEHMSRCIEDLVESDHLPRGSLEEAFGLVCDEPDPGLIPLEGDGPTNTTETTSNGVNGTLEKTSHDGGDGGDHGPSTTPQPGVPLRRRTKGPALSRPMVSDPLVPPSEPKAHVDDHVGEGGEPTKEHQVPNPHEQLQLVDAKKPQKIAKKRAVAAAEAEAADGAPSKKPKSEPGNQNELPVPDGMPEECLPCDGKRGRLSYTIFNEASGAKVEVLLKGRAFRISKLARFDKTGHPIPIPVVKQRPWGNNIADAWEEIKKLCGWQSPGC